MTSFVWIRIIRIHSHISISMSKINLKELTIVKAHEALKNGEFTAVELTQAYLDEIKKKNKDINAYLEVFDDAIEQANEADRKIQNSKFKIPRRKQPQIFQCCLVFHVLSKITF